MRSPLPLLVLALALPGAALAQSVTLAYAGSTGDSTFTVGPASCDISVSVTYTASSVSGALPCGNVELWVTTGSSCAEEPASSDYSFATVSQDELTTGQGTGSKSFQVSLLPIFNSSAADGGTTFVCGDQDERTLRVCSNIRTQAALGTCTTNKGSTLNLRYDGKAPGVPTLDDVASLDSALLVHGTGDSDTAQIHVLIRRAGDTDFTEAGSIASDDGSLRITKLTNDVTYEVQGAAEDLAGNVSASSAITTGVPRHTSGFWDKYQDSNGGETGGCTAAGGGLWSGALVGLLAGLALLRRRRG